MNIKEPCRFLKVARSSYYHRPSHDPNLEDEMLMQAIELYGCPEIFNTDQGCQFTSEEFTSVLKMHKIRISMDGKRRIMGNRMIERLWRSVKYDDIYIRAYESMSELYQGLNSFFRKYNNRKHQGIKQSPDQRYQASEQFAALVPNICYVS